MNRILRDNPNFQRLNSRQRDLLLRVMLFDNEGGPCLPDYHYERTAIEAARNIRRKDALNTKGLDELHHIMTTLNLR